MEKFFIRFGCFAIWIVAAQAASIPFDESVLSGDLLLTKRQHAILSGTVFREECEQVIGKWDKNEDGLVVIPYTFDCEAEYDDSDTAIIINDLKTIESRTCIRFKPREDEADYVEFVSGHGCFSPLGKQGGRQIISLHRPYCLSQGVPAHETIHSLGFHHMQNAFDRDNYVEILWDNIAPDASFNFEKVDEEFFQYFGTTYDFESIMHYTRTSASKNGEDTIIPRPAYIDQLDVMGQTGKISEGDYARINAMYECN